MPEQTSQRLCRPIVPNYLPASTLYLLPAKLLLSKPPSLAHFLPLRYGVPATFSAYSLLPTLSEIKAFVLFPAAYLAARQIAPLVSKWPQQKDNDKRAVSQLSFPLSAPTSHITVIDCGVSGSAIVPQDTREPCQEL